MVHTLLMILLVVILLNLIVFLFFDRPRYWGANLPASAQDSACEVQHGLCGGSDGDRSEASAG